MSTALFTLALAGIAAAAYPDYYYTRYYRPSSVVDPTVCQRWNSACTQYTGAPNSTHYLASDCRLNGTYTTSGPVATFPAYSAFCEWGVGSSDVFVNDAIAQKIWLLPTNQTCPACASSSSSVHSARATGV